MVSAALGHPAAAIGLAIGFSMTALVLMELTALYTGMVNTGFIVIFSIALALITAGAGERRGRAKAAKEKGA